MENKRSEREREKLNERKKEDERCGNVEEGENKQKKTKWKGIQK